MSTNILINGANGTMGRVIASIAQKNPAKYKIVAGIDCVSGKGESGFPIYTSFDDVKESFDAIIDFSVPAALPSVLAAAIKNKCGVVIATTGLSADDHEKIKQASTQIPIFFSANMSLGVNLQMDLIKRAASFLGEQFDIEIVEKHHNQKVDAPSGTALMLADTLSSQFIHGKEYVFDRSKTREKRQKNQLGISAVRGGTVVGEHQVLFLGEDEVLEINHIAHSKRIFAVGALRAATFLIGREPRLYSMSEVIARETRVTKIDCTKNQTIITISLQYSPALIAKVFQSFASINIDMISKTFPSAGMSTISFTVDSEHVTAVRQALQLNEITDIHCIDDVSKCCIEGDGMEYQSGVAAEIFELLEQVNVEPLIISTSETKISFCFKQEDTDKVIDSVTKYFEL